MAKGKKTLTPEEMFNQFYEVEPRFLTAFKFHKRVLERINKASCFKSTSDAFDMLVTMLFEGSAAIYNFRKYILEDNQRCAGDLIYWIRRFILFLIDLEYTLSVLYYKRKGVLYEDRKRKKRIFMDDSYNHQSQP